MAGSNEKIASALQLVDTAKLEADMPSEIKEALERFGFDALVAQVNGVAAINEKSAAELIGRSFFQRRAEQRLINDGLSALRSIREG